MIDLIIMSQWIMNHESIYILNVYILIYKRINILELLCFAKYKHTNIHTYIHLLKQSATSLLFVTWWCCDLQICRCTTNKQRFDAMDAASSIVQIAPEPEQVREDAAKADADESDTNSATSVSDSPLLDVAFFFQDGCLCLCS